MSPCEISAIGRLFLSFVSVQTVLAGPLTFAHGESRESPRSLHDIGWLAGRAVTKDFTASNSNLGAEIWPDKTITYAYKDDAAKEALDADLRKAWKVWEDALPKGSGFKFVLAEDEDAKDAADPYLLTVSYDRPVAEGGKGSLKTSVAIPNSGAPTMTLSNDTTKGSGNVVTNYAHEIGHAWGFEHIHQNPNYWSKQFANGQGSAIFTEKNWHPKNLADYETAIKYVDGKKAKAKDQESKDEWEKRKTTMLTNRLEAARAEFSAKEWLPMTTTDKYALEPETTSKTDIDWESIMIYPSESGAKKGLSVLTKPNGAKIVANHKPSQKDIDALMAMYKNQDESDQSSASSSGDGE